MMSLRFAWVGFHCIESVFRVAQTDGFSNLSKHSTWRSPEKTHPMIPNLENQPASEVSTGFTMPIVIQQAWCSNISQTRTSADIHLINPYHASGQGVNNTNKSVGAVRIVCFRSVRQGSHLTILLESQEVTSKQGQRCLRKSSGL